MTRKEQIKEYLRIIGNGETMGIPFDVGFECGVEWADKHPHWISVEDELPKDYEPVLAAFANHFARVCFHCGKTWYLNKPLAAEEMEGITHWMPLPAPPHHFPDVNKMVSGSSEFPNNCKKFDMKDCLKENDKKD